jgi:hypothetical protein
MVNETSLFAIYAEAEGHARPLIQLDLSFARLMDDIVVPYQSEQPFFIDGVPVTVAQSCVCRGDGFPAVVYLR